MEIVNLPVDKDSLNELEKIPISFEVKSQFNIELLEGGLGGMVFHEEPVIPPERRDFDKDEGQGPHRWLQNFDVSSWRMLVCREGDTPAGGLVIAREYRDSYASVQPLPGFGIQMLEGRDDLALVWNIRVQPAYRHSGIGSRLFNEAIKWSKEQGLKQLKVETQNNNVNACRFYARQGCKLGEIHRYKYIDVPAYAHEVMLVWYLDL
jgi:streptothricin acetyltransferase